MKEPFSSRRWEARSGRRYATLTNFWTPGRYAFVTASICAPPCQCDGYEVGLSFAEIGEEGGQYVSPVWPFLSAKTEIEALNLAVLLRRAGRKVMKVPDVDGLSVEKRLVAAAQAVARRLGYVARISSLYGPPVGLEGSK